MAGRLDVVIRGESGRVTEEEHEREGGKKAPTVRVAVLELECHQRKETTKL